MEVDPDTGLPAYREVGVLVPRQQGKTVLILSVMVHRCMGSFAPPRGPRQNVLYTAQNGSSARTKLEKDFLPTLKGSPLSTHFTSRLSIGHECIRWRNGSWFQLTSTTQSAGHGETLDLGVIDEAWAQVDDRLEQSYKPAMLTRADAQMWWLSTAGKLTSTYLAGKMETGRALVEAGVTNGVCYFEWSADPRQNPADPKTWYACMPALGHTISAATVAAEQKSMKPPEFARAMLNIPETLMPTEWAVIPEAMWTELADKASTPIDPVAFAIDVTPERGFASIGVAGRREDQKIHVELVEHRKGTGWVVERMVELVKQWKPCAVVIDTGGPAGSLVTALELAGVDITIASLRDHTRACGQIYDLAQNGKLRHRDQVKLNAAVAGVKQRPLGDAWAWARKGSSVDISPLVAVTLAAWGYHSKEVEQYDVLDSVLGEPPPPKTERDVDGLGGRWS